MFNLKFGVFQAGFGEHIVEIHTKIGLQDSAGLTWRQMQIVSYIVKRQIRVIIAADYFVDLKLSVEL